MEKYIGFLVFLIIISYLAPKEEYAKYYHFLMGILILIMLLQGYADFWKKGEVEIEDKLSKDYEFFREEKEVGLSDSVFYWGTSDSYSDSHGENK